MSSDVLALFDLDHTLLTLDSDEAWVEFLIEEGILDRAEFERANHELVARYRRDFALSLRTSVVSVDPSRLHRGPWTRWPAT